MGLDKFEWTDELVKEFAAYYVLTSNKWVRDVDLHTFKQSKQQSIDKKDWEILSFKDIKNDNEYFKLNSKGLYQNNIIQYEYLIETMLLQYPIHSVKRLSDNEVFSIGDITNDGRITGFTIDKQIPHRLEVWFENGSRYSNLDSIKKQKQPLFTTQDGKQIYEGDEFWYIDINERFSLPPTKYDSTLGGIYWKSYASKTFSTEEAAKEYILKNKPCLSLKDIETASLQAGKIIWGEDEYLSVRMNTLKELAQEKLKQ